MRIIVCGSRTFGVGSLTSPEQQARAKQHQNVMGLTLRRYFPTGYAAAHLPSGTPVMVHGAADGADALANAWALNEGVPVDAFPAQWDVHGRAAGPLRNQQMLEAGATLCLAFVDKPLAESKGTHDMVMRCVNAGVMTIVTMVMP